MRCGYCCYLCKEGGGERTNIPCKFLSFDSNNKASCSIYHRKDRIGTYIGIPHKEGKLGNYCVPIEDVFHRSPNCPYNKFFE